MVSRRKEGGLYRIPGSARQQHKLRTTWVKSLTAGETERRERERERGSNYRKNLLHSPPFSPLLLSVVVVDVVENGGVLRTATASAARKLIKDVHLCAAAQRPVGVSACADEKSYCAVVNRRPGPPSDWSGKFEVRKKTLPLSGHTAQLASSEHCLLDSRVE